MSHLRSVLVSLATLFLLTACPEPEPTLDDEACEHLAGGPAVAVTAAATGDGPLIGEEHTRYDVALVPVTGGNGGAVRFASAEAGDHVFFLGAGVPLAVVDGSGQTVTPEETRTTGLACAEQKARVVVPLGVGTYHLRFGPTTESEVRVVVEREGGHAE